MADDAPMTKPSENGKFAAVARTELAVTALAFFAPVVGAVNVVRSLLAEASAPTPPGPTKK